METQTDTTEFTKSQYHAVLQGADGAVYFASNPIRAALRKAIETDLKEKKSSLVGIFKGKQVPTSNKVVETLVIG